MLPKGYTALPDHILEKKIIIVGAGISGLTCAEALQKCNFKNITILEASDRIGGRLDTFGCKSKVDKDSRNYVEMGAQRVPGDSFIYMSANEFKQIDETAPDYSATLENFELVYDKNECSAIASLRTYFSRRLCLPKDFNDILVDREFMQLFEKCEGHSVECMKDYMKGAYQWWYGMSYEYTFKNKQAELNFGYSGLLQSIFKKLPKETIVMKKEVININWSDFQNENLKSNSTDDPKIKIQCRDGSLYEADHVIIAIPLGYLKENFETLFIPSLSEDKIKAIQTLNFITVNKIFLEFEDPFWKLTDVYHVIWNERLDRLFNYHKHGSGQDPKKWLKYINRFEYVYTNSKILCAWIWGEGAVVMESLPEEEVSCCCMKLLRYLLKKSLPNPNNVIRSRWFSNPLFRGSLMYDPSQGVLHEIRKISESVSVKGNRLILQFAGDAAYEVDQMSTVDGAREAGSRAARELYMHNSLQAGTYFEDSQISTNLNEVHYV